MKIKDEQPFEAACLVLRDAACAVALHPQCPEFARSQLLDCFIEIGNYFGETDDDTWRREIAFACDGLAQRAQA